MKPVLWIIALHLVLMATFGLSLMDPDTMAGLAREDGIIESIGALAFLTASVCFMIAFFRTRQGSDLILIRSRRNIFLLLLSIACLVAGGEEISWGQRIFGWDTPAALAQMNSQGETTFHNLAIFQEKRLLNFYFMFNVFWMTFCVMVPLANRFALPRRLFERIGLPIPPLWVGTLLLATWVTFKCASFRMSALNLSRSSINELKETDSAIAFAILGAVMAYRALAKKPEQEGQPSS